MRTNKETDFIITKLIEAGIELEERVKKLEEDNILTRRSGV